jgi:hypothetical protein
VPLLRGGGRHTNTLAGRVHVQRGHSSTASPHEQHHPLQGNRDVPQWDFRPPGRDTGGAPPLLRSCDDSSVVRQTVSAGCSVISTGVSRGKFGQDNSNEGRSLWIRNAGRERGTPARVLADSERIEKRIVERQKCLNYSGVSSAPRKPTSTTRTTPKRVRQFIVESLQARKRQSTTGYRFTQLG